MSSENDNSNNGLIQQLLSYIPKGFQAIFAILIIFVTLSVIIKQNFPDLFKQKKDTDCESINLIGKIVDSKTREPIKIKKITLEGFNLNPDLNSNEGVFTFFGVKLPSHKIISLEITSQNGKNYITQRYNLNNESRYPTNNCNIDMGTIPIDIIGESNLKKNIKKNIINRKKIVKNNFVISNQIDRSLINYFEEILNMKYELIGYKYNIKFVETGKIESVNQDKTQFMYSGGEIVIKVNSKECGKLPDAIISRTMPSGNDYYFVKSEIEKQIIDKISLQKYSAAKILKECIN